MKTMDYGIKSSGPKRLLSLPRVRFFVAIVLLASIAYGLFGGETKSSGSAKHSVATIALGTLEDIVTSQGKLEPKEYVDVGAQVSGQLKNIPVAIGDVVKPGQLLAEIDPRIYESRVAADKARLKTLKAQVSEQQANIDFAQQQYARNQRLIKSDAISKETLEDSSTNLKVAQARKAALEAQIKEAVEKAIAQ